MKLTKSLAALASASLLLTACGGGDSGASENEIVLGIVTDSSGGASAYSPFTEAGIQLAVDEINDAGGIDGKKIRVVEESDGSDTTQTPTIARRLIDDGAQVLVLNSGSASAIAAKVVCVEEDILCVAPTNLSSSIVEEPDNENIFILGPTSTGIGDAFAEGMSAAGYEKVAVIADDVATIQDYVPAIVGPIEEAGVSEVAEEKVAADASDVSAQIARVKDSDPDVVLVMSLGGQTEAVVQNALHRAMPDVPRFSLASIGNQPATWELADEGALEGVVFAGSIDPANKRTAEFADKLAEVGGEHSELTAYGPQGYDAVQLISQAIEAAGGASDKGAVTDAFMELSGYQAHYGQDAYTMSFAEDKHVGADGNCGLVLAQFGADNKPGEAWAEYQPSCD
ncbi:ABC transporter substrate-binding protein [Nocardioides dongkuii]|uniref:ABC transporter substrate-binding protein n=1 Tax=Nocardioides dongkuii TaxID=2760089 RepID=UPI0015FBE002|nr:ABC transporter substrate-binding protein [Nocardioides dongkuii]